MNYFRESKSYRGGKISVDLGLEARGEMTADGHQNTGCWECSKTAVVMAAQLSAFIKIHQVLYLMDSVTCKLYLNKAVKKQKSNLLLVPQSKENTALCT